MITGIIVTIVDNDGPPLMGRNWLKHLRLDWHRIANVNAAQNQLDDLLSNYEEILRDELGTAQNYQATLHLKEGTRPDLAVFHLQSVKQ